MAKSIVWFCSAVKNVVAYFSTRGVFCVSIKKSVYMGPLDSCWNFLFARHSSAVGEMRDAVTSDTKPNEANPCSRSLVLCSSKEWIEVQSDNDASTHVTLAQLLALEWLCHLKNKSHLCFFSYWLPLYNATSGPILDMDVKLHKVQCGIIERRLTCRMPSLSLQNVAGRYL